MGAEVVQNNDESIIFFTQILCHSDPISLLIKNSIKCNKDVSLYHCFLIEWPETNFH